MVSIRATARCINLDMENFRLARDFFGYMMGPPLFGTISLLTQVRLLQGHHVHMNFIRVGSDQYTNDDLRDIDQALQITRDIYAQVGLGVGRIEHYPIPTADADFAENINNRDEAIELTIRWTVPNDALDIFFVLSYSGDTIGSSRINGPCDKDAEGMNGSVVSLEGVSIVTGFVLAHEAGHYLGLHHNSNFDNLMFKGLLLGRQLTDSQGSDMRKHCFVNSGC